MQIYALTQKDVEYIGMAASVGGGGITAWGDDDNKHSLPEIIRRHVPRGYEYLGTMQGYYGRPLTNDRVESILQEAEALDAQRTSTHRIIIEGKTALAERCKQIREWMEKI
jgi:hypothetical protein